MLKSSYYLDDEAPGEAGNKEDDNESPPTKKRRKLSFKNTQKNGVEEKGLEGGHMLLSIK